MNSEISSPEHRAVDRAHFHVSAHPPHQEVFQRRVVLDEFFHAAVVRAVEGGLGDVQVTVVDQPRIVAEEKGQEQGADMRAVHVGVGHDHDFVVAKL